MYNQLPYKHTDVLHYIIGNQEPGSNLLKAFFLEVMQRSTYSRKKESPPDKWRPLPILGWTT